MRVVGVLPTRGRLEATIALIPRLLVTANWPSFDLVVLVDGVQNEYDAIASRVVPNQQGYTLQLVERGQGYWKMMSMGAMMVPSADLIINLANDLLPGRQWLRRAVLSYQDQFGPNEHGLLGLNDGIHDGGSHCGHFLVHRNLLARWYGEDVLYPPHYFHLYGDTELIDRAKEEDLYAVEPWAVLYHNHPGAGAPSDAIYTLAHDRYWRDRKIYEHRKAHGWNSSLSDMAS